MSVKDNLEINFSKVFFIKNISMLGLASKCQLSSSKSSYMCFDMEKSNLIDVFYLFIFFSLWCFNEIFSSIYVDFIRNHVMIRTNHKQVKDFLAWAKKKGKVKQKWKSIKSLNLIYQDAFDSFKSAQLNVDRMLLMPCNLRSIIYHNYN